MVIILDDTGMVNLFQAECDVSVLKVLNVFDTFEFGIEIIWFKKYWTQ